jgi:hypothetical protein
MREMGRISAFKSCMRENYITEAANTRAFCAPFIGFGLHCMAVGRHPLTRTLLEKRFSVL